MPDTAKKRREKLWRWLKISVIVLLLAAGLLRLMISSYAFDLLYLPMASDLIGFKITAADTKLHLLDGRITFQGLLVDTGDGNLFSAETCESALSWDRLFHERIIRLDAINIQDAMLSVSNTDVFYKKTEKLEGLKKLQIGIVAIHHLTIRYSPKNSSVFGRINIPQLNADSIVPGEQNAIQLRTAIAWNGKNNEALSLPLTGKILYHLDEDFIPVKLQATVETDQSAMHIYNKDLSDMRLNAELRAEMPVPGMVRIELLRFSQYQGGRKNFQAELNGVYDLQNGAGTAKIQVNATDALPVLDQLFGLTDRKEDLQKIGLAMNMDLSQAKNCFSLNGFDLNVTRGDKEIVRAKSRGLFSVQYDPAGQHWNIQDAGAKAEVSLTGFPINVISPFVPGDLDGTLNANGTFSVDDTVKQITGKIEGGVDDLKFLFGDMESSLPAHSMKFQAQFRSKGMKKLTELLIPSFAIQFGHGRDIVTNASFSGKCTFGDAPVITLDGAWDTKLIPLLEHFDDGPAKWIVEKVKTACPDLKKHLTIQQRFDWKKKTLDIRTNTTISGLDFHRNAKIRPPKDHAAADILVAARVSLYLGRGPAKPQLLRATVTLPGHLQLRASSRADFDKEQYTADLTLEQLSPDVLRWAGYILEQEDPYILEMLRKLKYHNLTAATQLRIDGRSHDLTVMPAEIKLLYGKDQILHFKLDSPISGNFMSGKYKTATAELKIINIPTTIANIFIPDKMRFIFHNSPVNGSASFQLKDLCREISFHTEFFIDDLIAQKRRIKFRYGSCSVQGDGAFKDYFRTFSYENGIGKAYTESQPDLIVTSHGCMELFHPYKADFYLNTELATAKHLRKMFDFVLFKEFDAVGPYSIHCINNYSKIRLKMHQTIRKAVPVYPEDLTNSAPHLTGELALEYTLNGEDNSLFLNRSRLFLRDNNSKADVLDLNMHGSWLQKQGKNDSECALTSSSVDCQMIYRMLRGAYEWKEKNPDAVTGKMLSVTPAPPSFKKPVLLVHRYKKGAPLWPVRSDEPIDLDLAGFSTNLKLALNGLTYTEKLKTDIQAQLSTTASKFTGSVQGKINQTGTLTLSGVADLSKKDGWELKADGRITDLDFVPFIECFASKKLKDKKITGTISNLEFQASTKGITLESLDKNLSLNAKLIFRNISFPLYSGDSLSALQIMVMPVTLLPRLFDAVPAIRKFTGGDHVDILSGRENILLENGGIVVQSGAAGKRTDLVLTKCSMHGPVILIKADQMMINPFHNQLKGQTLTKFGGFIYPITLAGTLDDVQLDRKNAVTDFLKYNSQHGLQKLLPIEIDSKNDQKTE